MLDATMYTTISFVSADAPVAILTDNIIFPVVDGSVVKLIFLMLILPSSSKE